MCLTEKPPNQEMRQRPLLDVQGNHSYFALSQKEQEEKNVEELPLRGKAKLLKVSKNKCQ